MRSLSTMMRKTPKKQLQSSTTKKWAGKRSVLSGASEARTTTLQRAKLLANRKNRLNSNAFRGADGTMTEEVVTVVMIETATDAVERTATTVASLDISLATAEPGEGPEADLTSKHS